MKQFITSLLVISLFAGFTFDSPEYSIKAKIGVMKKSGDDINKAKSNDNALAGDEVRVFIVPENDCYVYVVFNDGKSAVLLTTKFASSKKALFLPGEKNFYKFDKSSKLGEFFIYCSAEKLGEIDKIFKGKSSINSSDWKTVASKIENENKESVSDDADKPITMAGNVRGANVSNEQFQKALQSFSGKSIIIKKYIFSVKI